MSFIAEQISTYFLCKGTWIPIPHCVLKSKVYKINEHYGYCKVCWDNGFKDNIGSPNPEGLNPDNFKQCGSDTL